MLPLLPVGPDLDGDLLLVDVLLLQVLVAPVLQDRRRPRRCRSPATRPARSGSSSPPCSRACFSSSVADDRGVGLVADPRVDGEVERPAGARRRAAARVLAAWRRRSGAPSSTCPDLRAAAGGERERAGRDERDAPIAASGRRYRFVSLIRTSSSRPPWWWPSVPRSTHRASWPILCRRARVIDARLRCAGPPPG